MPSLAERKLIEIQIADQRIDNGIALPVVLAPGAQDAGVAVEEVVECIKEQKQWIEELFHESGALLLRGCGVKSAADFNSVVEAFGYEDSSYYGGLAQRSHVLGRVYTANESPPEVNISFHHEMAMYPNHPLKLFFYCELAPIKGGETPLLWSHKLVDRLITECPEFVKNLEEKGLLYQLYFGEQNVSDAIIVRSWKTFFDATDKLEAEKSASKKFEGTPVKLDWYPEGGVKLIIGPMPGLKLDTVRGRAVFFNYIIGHKTPRDRKVEDVEPFEGVLFGDGTSLPKEAIDTIFKIVEDEKVLFKWQEGDVLLVDNIAVQHARAPCYTPRRILASLTR